MKHWDGRDRTEAEHPLSPAERARLRALFEPPAHRRQPPQIGSVIGLVLAVGLLVGLALLLAPAEPISSKVLH